MAWSPEKIADFKRGFNEFLKNCKINSKNTGGYSPFVLYGSQKRFLTEVFNGLANDVHFFVILKARQLGISTVVRALIVFWAFIHPGLRVALAYDTEKNKEDAREEVKQFLASLDPGWKLTTDSHNRYQTNFPNGSRLSYLVAGVKKSKGSGGLGRSLGINCAGCTEISSWGDIEGLRAFERSLSQTFENRLYIFESTARGFGNPFYSVWREAKADDLSKKAVFIGWWAHDDYRYKTGTKLFERYGEAPPTPDEQTKIDRVRERYGAEVNQEQLAWYRHQYDPGQDEEGGDQQQMAGQEIIKQELPWDEDEAWLMSGSDFFPSDRLTEEMKISIRQPFKGYDYYFTDEFMETLVRESARPARAQLKIYEEPDPTALYVIGCDPAYGSSENSYNHVAQVMKCYADGVDQVAEFCSSEPDTTQFAWAIAHLCGAYAGADRGARLLFELNGPGHAVWTEIRSLRKLIELGYLQQAAEDKGLTNIFRHVREYMWAKMDSLNRNPSAFHWETSLKRKAEIFERLRGLFNTRNIKIRSVECLQEMQKVIREGDSISGEGSTPYDRVMALAIAVRCWEDGERPRLIREQRTRENESKSKTFTSEDLQKIFSENLIQEMFSRNRVTATRQRTALRKGNRWNW